MSPGKRWRTCRPTPPLSCAFDELGGQLTAEEEQQADSYAQQLMDQYGDTYKANGIGLETVQHFERILLKSNDLLTLVYGNGGETPRLGRRPDGASGKQHGGTGLLRCPALQHQHLCLCG